MYATTVPAGAPTGTGPALPQYLSDAEAAALHEQMRERALCDADGIVDWLMGECMGAQAYEGRAYCATYDADALRMDYANAAKLRTPELLALAFGLTPSKEARIAAMDELAKRAGVVA